MCVQAVDDANAAAADAPAVETPVEIDTAETEVHAHIVMDRRISACVWV